ncbi:MAG: response regulator, partial [Deltaproteobacteria bacterium]|nr:response regulator [Deltaproteobacteria bacterium]
MERASLLLVDDERNILSSLRRLFRKEGYEINTAESGAEALDLLDDHEVHVIVSDYRMPNMTGVEFFGEVKKLHPDTIRVILSGYADAEAIVSAINQGEVYRFMPKPWNAEELKATIRQCFERYTLYRENKKLLDKVRRQNQELLHLNQKLESSLTMSMRSLDIVQKILAVLPVPVVGVSTDGTIVLANQASFGLSRWLQPEIGLDMEEVLPEKLVKPITGAFQGRDSKVGLA